MIVSYHSYKVEIKDIPFTTPEGITFEKTVTVAFFNDIGEIITFNEYGYTKTKYIYDKIEKKEPVNIDYCYIKNFSLTAYRLYTIQKKETVIELIDFSAKNAFFDSNFIIDFSHATFNDVLTNFQDTQFVNGVTSFNSVVFGKKGVDFSNAFFRNGNVDFSKANFGDGNVNFKNVIFRKGKKDFQYTVFGLGKTSFINTEFNDGEVSFINTNFGDGELSFRVARFGEGKIDFRFAKFGAGELSFDRTEFGNGVFDFRTVEIKSEKVNFSRSIFGDGDVIFEGIQVDTGRINFKRALFGHGKKSFELAECENASFIFDRTDFGQGSLSFYNSKFNVLSLQSCHFDFYLDLRMAKCELVDLSDSITRDIIDLKPFDFKVDIKTINFTGMRLIGRIFIDWENNNVVQLIDSQKQKDHAIVAEQYRILKENFSVTGQYLDEDKAYIEFKRHEAKAKLINRKKKHKYNKYWCYPTYWFEQLVFDKAGQYATNPLRVLLSMVVSYFAFSIIYLLFSILPHSGVITGLDPQYDLSLVGRSFYVSAITFLTIGYGDFVPYGPLRILAGIEGFTGLFLMSYFTVAFVRKILR